MENMENRKKIVGIPVEGQNWQGRTITCEVLEADKHVLRYRTTFKDTGEVFENLWAEDNPMAPHGMGRRVRTWRNGDELSAEKASGYNFQEPCFCTVLGKVFGEEFSGYKENYVFKDGYAFHGYVFPE